MTDSHSQPMNATPVCCYCDADLSCSACGMEQPGDDVSDLRTRLAEHEANARAYEEIIGKKTYREVAEELKELAANAEQSWTLAGRAEERLSIARKALESAAGRFNMLSGVGLVNGADPKAGYRAAMDAIKDISK